jgi:hypothetical protein|tara:strand:- start:905 stop:1096 length:192 start_codon:yes stop_codon:yes gene_type:complete
MKIKIEFTVEVEASVIEAYMQELNVTDESKRQFVQSWIKSGGIGSLEESLANNGFGFNTVLEV